MLLIIEKCLTVYLLSKNRAALNVLWLVQMRLLDRYIAKQVFVSAIFSVTVILVILILGNVFKEILRELDKRPDLSLGFVFRFIALVVPISLSLAIPFSFLTSILLTFGRLSADSEFIAMRMSGQSIWRICLPIGVLALFFTVICGWFNLSITPAAKTEMEGMKASVINMVKREPLLIFPDQAVMDDIDGHLVYARKGESSLHAFQMIKLENGLPEALVVARKAEVSVNLEEGVPELVFDFTDFNMMTKGQEGDFMAASQPIFFKSGQIGLKLPDNTNEDVRDQPDNISLRRLTRIIGEEGIEPEKRAAYRTELSTRMAFSVSCLMFGLIGVPLGITAQRRESTAGFVIALTIAISYYVLLITAQMHNTNEAMFPHLLVWVPNLLCLGLGLFLFWRLSRK